MTDQDQAQQKAAEKAAIAAGLKTIGPIVYMDSDEFLEILTMSERPLVVYSPKRLIGTHKYLTSYKGITFYTKSRQWLELDESCEVVTCKTIWVP